MLDISDDAFGTAVELPKIVRRTTSFQKSRSRVIAGVTLPTSNQSHGHMLAGAQSAPWTPAVVTAGAFVIFHLSRDSRLWPGLESTAGLGSSEEREDEGRIMTNRPACPCSFLSSPAGREKSITGIPKLAESWWPWRCGVFLPGFRTLSAIIRSRGLHGFSEGRRAGERGGGEGVKG
jgi:hypothetical protein